MLGIKAMSKCWVKRWVTRLGYVTSQHAVVWPSTTPCTGQGVPNHIQLFQNIPFSLKFPFPSSVTPPFPPSIPPVRLSRPSRLFPFSGLIRTSTGPRQSGVSQNPSVNNVLTAAAETPVHRLNLDRCQENASYEWNRGSGMSARGQKE